MPVLVEDPYPGMTVGCYQLEDCLGRGGFGEVWRATALEGARVPRGHKVALKLALEPDYVELLRAEGALQLWLEHPGIVRVFEVNTAPPRPYVVMELVEGTNLREHLRAHGPLAVDEAEDLLFHLLEILEFTHARGVVHRDLKPGNILLARSGRVKLSDFGLGTSAGRLAGRLLVSEGLATRSGVTAAGTYPYLAPELRPGGAGGPRAVDGRADLYSVGVILFEVLTGRLPGGLERPSALRRGVPRRLDRVFELCYVADPRRRVRSVQALRRELIRGERRAMAARAAVLACAGALAAAVLVPPWGGPAVPPEHGQRAVAAARTAEVEGARARRTSFRAAPVMQAVRAAGATGAGAAFGATRRAEAPPPGAGAGARAGEAQAWAARGERLAAAGRWAVARECFRAALAALEPDGEDSAAPVDPAWREALQLRLEHAARRADAQAEAERLRAEAERLYREYLELAAGRAPGVARYYVVSRAAEARRLLRRAAWLEQDPQGGAPPGPAPESLLAALEAHLARELEQLKLHAREAERAGRLQEAHATLLLASGLASAPALREELQERAQALARRLAPGEAEGAEIAALLRQGERYEVLGRYDEAVECYTQALALGGAAEELEPRIRRARAAAWRQRGDVHFRRREWREALAAYQRSLELQEEARTRAALAQARALLERR
ncbi:MAG: hypothetical protein KatS3mg102_0161 [Planctomycetota bacterium]|nr:MAG: hypothetical protein KatS3mg102_0161 [Planctomycetota bacterium]